MKKQRVLWIIRPTVRRHGTQRGYDRAKEKASSLKCHSLDQSLKKDDFLL